jgi:TRAP-type C4-dicarboxylate transport system permease small subunit
VASARLSDQSKGFPAMDRLLRLARLTSRAGAWLGGGLVTLAAVIISVDVLMRKLFDTTLGGASEISGYVLAVSTTWALALTLLDRAHVRIDSLYTLLPTRICAVLDILALLSFMVFAGFLTWQGWIMFAQSASLNSHSLTPLAIPLAIPQLLWVAGFAFFFVVMLLLLVRALTALATGRFEDVQRLLGSRTALQELEEAIQEHERYKDA